MEIGLGFGGLCRRRWVRVGGEERLDSEEEERVRREKGVASGMDWREHH